MHVDDTIQQNWGGIRTAFKSLFLSGIIGISIINELTQTKPTL